MLISLLTAALIAHAGEPGHTHPEFKPMPEVCFAWDDDCVSDLDVASDQSGQMVAVELVNDTSRLRPGEPPLYLDLLFMAAVFFALASVVVYGIMMARLAIKEADARVKIAEANRDAEMCALVDRELARDELEKFRLIAPKENVT